MKITIDMVIVAGMSFLGIVGKLILDAGNPYLADRFLTLALILAVVFLVRFAGGMLTWMVGGR